MDNRPYIVCHMLSTLDGKITGDAMKAPEAEAGGVAFGKVRVDYQCDATLYGTVTMQDTYSEGVLKDLPKAETVYDRTDYVAPTDVNNYIVSIDMNGTLAFSDKYIEKKKRPRAHLIQVLSDNVSDDYIAYLRGLDISYIFGGNEQLDCRRVLKKLKEMFGIERLMISGGGYINWTFLQENLIDELSLIVIPVTDGSTDAVSVFEKSDFLPPRDPAGFRLKQVSVLDGDCVWLQYLLKNPELL